MLTQLLLAPLFIAASAVAHPAVTRRGDVPLSEWSSQNLESYWRFKVRYNSLNCASQTGTDFYTNCCSPLGASDSLSDRPAECTPSSLTCDTSSTSSLSTPPPAPAASSTDDDDYDESSLPYCEEGDDGYDDGNDDSSSDNSGSNNGGSSTDNSNPTDNSSSDNSQPQPTDSGNSGDNSGDNNNSNTGSSTDNGGNYGAQNTGGHATYYYQNGNAGACGDYHGDGDMIGAIDVAWYGDMGSRSQYCGQKVHITNLNNGKTVDIIVADVCPTCDGDNSFDLSEGAFSAIAALGDGYVPISWSFA